MMDLSIYRLRFCLIALGHHQGMVTIDTLKELLTIAPNTGVKTNHAQNQEETHI